MPARIAFLQDNKYLSPAVLTASSSASALPVTASQNPDRSYIWRSLAQTGVQTIDIDLTTSLAVSSVALANSRTLPSGGVIEVYERGTAATPGTATLVATLPAQDAQTLTAVVFFASQTKRHWQLRWTNPGAVAAVAELGFAFLGVESVPTRNVRAPARIDRVDPSIGALSLDGQATFVRRTKYFAGAWQFTLVSEADLTTLREYFHAGGTSLPLFMVLRDTLSWTCWYARFTGALGIEVSPHQAVGRYTVTMPWQEAR